MDWLFKQTYVHQDRDNHQLGIEADERLVLDEAILVKKALLDDF